MKKLQIITCLGHGLCHISILVLAAVLIPIAKDLNLSLTELTSIGTICYFLFGIGSLPAGIITSLTNPKLTLLLFFASNAIASILVGFSPNVMMFGLCLALLGLSASIYHVSGLNLLANNISKIGKAYGIHGVAGSAGITLAPIIATVITTFLGWRYVYLFIAIPGILSFLWLFFDKTIPFKHTEKTHINTQNINHKLWLVFILFLIIMGINGFVYRGFLTIFPTYLSQKVSLLNINPLLTGGFVASFILATGMLGQYIGGILSDKFNKFLLYFLILSATMPLFFLMGNTTSLALILTAICFSLIYFPLQPIENSIITKLTPNKLMGSAFGLKFTMNFGLGSVGAVFAGFITETFDITKVFLYLGLITIISIVISLMVFILNKKED